MGLRPIKGHEDVAGRFFGINDLGRVFNGVPMGLLAHQR